MINQAILTVTMLISVLLTGPPVYEGDQVSFHLVGLENAREVMLRIENQDRVPASLLCYRDLGDGYWTCPFTAVAGTWVVKEVHYIAEEGVAKVYSVTEEDGWPSLEVLPMPSVLYLPFVKG